MTGDLLITAAIALGWFALALMLRRLYPRQRVRGFWALVVVGIPLLGWLTLIAGPMAGVLGLALGICVLLRAPRHGGAQRAAPPLD